jgi:hypothetical protein
MPRVPNRFKGGWSLALLACLAACASEVVRHPVELSSAAQPARYAVSSQISIELDSGYVRTVPPGTEFIETGAIGQGRVYRPASTVFTVEGAHQHEAYPVVKDARLVGFYLPVEKAFSPLSKSVAFPLQPRGY